jgi:hypothetical protein
MGPSERRDVLNRLEAFVSSELHNYVCQICFELMAPPDRPPVMLVPCGHTFCKACSRPDLKKCPYCREVCLPACPPAELVDWPLT